MRQFLGIVFIFLILLLPKPAKAKSTPVVNISVPEKILSQEIFTVSFHLENIPINQNYKIKIWAQKTLGENIKTENWDSNNQIWRSAYKTSRYYIENSGLSGSLNMRILDYSDLNMIIKASVSICDNQNECSTYSSDGIPIILTISNFNQYLVSYPTEIANNPFNYYLRTENNSIAQPVCVNSDYCDLTQINSLENLYEENFYIIDKLNNQPIFQSVKNTVPIILSQIDLGCENFSSEIIATEYTIFQPQNIFCQNVQKTVWIDESGNGFTEKIIIPHHDIISKIYNLKYFDFDYILVKENSIKSRPIKNRIVSELSPIGEEWIELFNPAEKPISICGWMLDDGEGGSSPYNITDNCEIPSNNYKIITLTKHLFNDDGDLFELKDSNGNIVESFSYSKLKENQSLIFYNGTWQITDSPTKEIENIFYQIPKIIQYEQPIVRNLVTDDFIYKIKINEICAYLNKKVQVTGKIINPSGSVWFLQDETGIVKIYLQSKYKIKHPRYKTGMQMSVIGRVNKYRNVWRILPESEIDLIILNDLSKKTVQPKNNKIESVQADQTKNTEVKISTIPTAQAMELPHYNPLTINQNVENSQTKTFAKSLRWPASLVIINCLGIIILWHGKFRNTIHFKRKRT